MPCGCIGEAVPTGGTRARRHTPCAISRASWHHASTTAKRCPSTCCRRPEIWYIHLCQTQLPPSAHLHAPWGTPKPDSVTKNAPLIIELKTQRLMTPRAARVWSGGLGTQLSHQPPSTSLSLHALCKRKIGHTLAAVQASPCMNSPECQALLCDALSASLVEGWWRVGWPPPRTHRHVRWVTCALSARVLLQRAVHTMPFLDLLLPTTYTRPVVTPFWRPSPEIPSTSSRP
mmetsp:Transcript_92587/g.155369  ORF Transcript_92587/g.155369 Transcript_92587/m.155369 type:complete len:231 (+) Transcript_92587:192-884(+)